MPLPDLEPPFGRLVHEMWESAMTRNQRDARYCDICKRSEHHAPDCPEMFFKKRDGSPDRSKPRGVVPPGALPPLRPVTEVYRAALQAVRVPDAHPPLPPANPSLLSDIEKEPR
jgi:hypothetical protein